MSINNVNLNFATSVPAVRTNKAIQTNPVEKPTNLESSPAVDTVSFRGSEKVDEYKNYSCKDADMLKYDLEYSKPSFFNRNYEIIGDDVELSVKNKFGGVQNIYGEANEKHVDVNVDSGFFGIRKGKVYGTIGDKEISVEYKANETSKNIKIKGDLDHLDKDEKALLTMLISDKFKYDLRVEQEMEMVAIASTL